MGKIGTNTIHLVEGKSPIEKQLTTCSHGEYKKPSSSPCMNLEVFLVFYTYICAKEDQYTSKKKKNTNKKLPEQIPKLHLTFLTPTSLMESFDLLLFNGII
jgi:hypothetical protein